jgi:phosphate-selective porin
MRIPVLAAACVALPAVAAAQQGAAQGEFEITPTAYVQLDFRAFPDWPIEPGTARLKFDTVEVRRVRAGVDGSWKRYAFELSIDPTDEDGTVVKDAYGQLRAGGYRIRAGQFKLPGSREYATSARNTDFMERAGLASSLAAQRDIGVMVLGRLTRRIDYQAGVFAGDDNGENDRAGLTAAGRLEWEPSRTLIVAGYVSDGRLSAVESDPENGLDGRLPSGYRFYEDVYVQGQRLRLGGDVEWSPGAWQFTAEALRVRDERLEQGVDFDDLPSALATGVSLTARWRFKPRRDVALRYEYLGFDDAGPDTAVDSVRPRASNIRARAGSAVTLGGSWRLAPWLRVMGNAGVEWYSDARSAPDPTRTGGYFTMGTRLQIGLP